LVIEKYGWDITKVKRVRAIFDRIDVDNNGYIIRKEILDKKTGLEEEMDRMGLRFLFRGLDEDGDGKVTFVEFCALNTEEIL